MTPETLANLDYWLELITTADPISCDLTSFVRRFTDALEVL